MNREESTSASGAVGNGSQRSSVADRAARVAIATLLLILVMTALLLGSSLLCSASPDSTSCPVSDLVTDLNRNWSAVTAIQVACVLVVVFKIVTQKSSSRLSSVFAMLVLSASPILAQTVSDLWASQLGCYVTEHGTYTRSVPYDQRGCRMGDWDLDPLLHALHMAIFGVILTWPFIVISVANGVSLFFTRANRK
jgi:hypothetical protein